MYLKASDTERLYVGEKIFAKKLNVSINNWLSYCLTMLTVCAIDIFAFEITWRGYWLVMLHTGKALQRDPGSPALSICHRNTLQRNHIPGTLMEQRHEHLRHTATQKVKLQCQNS